ncbi:MAG: IS21 family transposase, partial [Actinobacteria bacterium]|nr:IS21 family transposase [Actinomycetota bacterium]
AAKGLVDVEQWAELRREHFVRGVSIKQLASRTGLSRNTVRAALRAPAPPKYQRAPAGSKLDPFKDEIHRLLKDDSAMAGQRIRELIAPLGFEGGKTIVDDYLREVRPFFVDQRTFQRTVYRPGEICQFDVWEPKDEIAVGHGQTRKAYVVVACLGYSRAAAGAVIFSKQTPDLLFGIRRCLWSLGALPQTLVWDRQSGLHAAGGRPTVEFAAFCGQLRVDWHFCDARDPQAKGVVERLQDFMERSFEPGRCFANELDFQLQLDCWFDERANARMHKTLRARPIDRLIEERGVMAPLPAPPDVDRRWVRRVPPDPFLRFDTCDYSLDPGLVGRRVDVRVDEREITAVALNSGEIACRHTRSFAKHRTITALEHARTLKTQRGERRGDDRGDVDVEVRSLALYDELIA